VIDDKRAINVVPYAWYRGNVMFGARNGENVNIWALPISPRSWLASGGPQRVTFGSGLEVGAAVSSSGRLVFLSVQATFNLFALPLKDGKAAGEPRQLTRNSVYNWSQNASRDGRQMAYASNRSGDWELWVRNLDSDNESLALRGESKVDSPIFSPDGSQIAFYLTGASGPNTLNVMPASGGSPRVVYGPAGPVVGWMPDGERVVFQGGDPSPTKSSTWHVAIADMRTGSVQRAGNQRPGLRPISLSPDGRSMVLELVAWTMSDGFERFVVPFRGGVVGPESEWISLGYGTGSAEWSPDGDLIYLVSGADGNPCIWARRFSRQRGTLDGESFPVLHFHDRNRKAPLPLQRFLTVTRDALVVTVVETSAELWMAQLR
jgi:hypothetical protein